MADDGFKVRNKMNIKPSSVAGDEAGDLRSDSADSNRPKWHDGTAEEKIILQDELDQLEYDNSTSGLTYTNAQDAIDELAMLTLNLSSTSLQSGCSITINGVDNTKFDVSAGTYHIINNYTDATTPTHVDLVYSGDTAVTVTNLATAPLTYVYLNASGNLVQRTSLADADVLRDEVHIGNLIHVSNVQIDAVNDTLLSPYSFDTQLALYDLNAAVGPINVSGNIYSAASTDLTIKRSSGLIHLTGVNFKTSTKNPNYSTTIAEDPITFGATWRDGSGSFIQTFTNTEINPGVYDDGTGGATEPNGTVGPSKYAIQRLYYTEALTVIQYGTTTYSNMAAAKAAIATEEFSLDPTLTGALLRGWLIVRGNATDLSDSDQAAFVAAGKFGGAAGAEATSSTTDLQTAYDNSTEPEIIVDTTRGALTVADAATPIGACLFEVIDNGETEEYLCVDATEVKTDKKFTLKSNSQTTSLQGSASASASVTYSLPPADGSANQVLTTDGSGAMSWEDTAAQSGINYIEANDAEDNTGGTTGWSTYADAAGTAPVDGTGGSPNITFTAQATTALRGSKSFLIIKDAANRQGEGVSYDFTLDRQDFYGSGQPIYVSFDIETDSNYIEDDLIPYIYDKDGAALVNLTRSGNGKRFTGVFYPTPGNDDYRLILHIAGTNTASLGILLDNFTVGPDKIIDSPIITPWESFTPTLTNFTASSTTCKYRRVNDTMQIMGTIVVNTVGTGDFVFSLPSGYTLDYSKMIRSSYSKVGSITYYDYGSGDGSHYTVLTNNSSTSEFIVNGPGGNWDNTYPITWAANDELHIVSIFVPILEWANSTAVLSSTELLNETVKAGAYLGSGNQTLTAGTGADIIFDQERFDNNSAYNTTTGRFVAPKTGKYKVIYALQYATGGTAPSAINTFVRINAAGVYAQQYNDNLAASKIFTQSGHAILDLTKGDSIGVYAESSAQNSTVNGNAIADSSYFYVEELPNFSVYGVYPEVATKVSAIPSAVTSVAGTATKITFGTANINIGEAWSTTNSEFTAPRAGTYMVSGSVGLASTAYTAGDRMVVEIYVGGVSQIVVSRPYAETTTAQLLLGQISGHLIELDAGDVLDIRAQQNSGSNVNTDVNITRLSIIEVR